MLALSLGECKGAEDPTAALGGGTQKPPGEGCKAQEVGAGLSPLWQPAGRRLKT